MPKKRSLLLLLLLIYAPLLLSHGVGLEIEHHGAGIIRLHHTDDTPVANSEYELSVAGAETPYQTGKTDSLGRVVFTPGEVREWRLRVFSQDGHGIDTTFELGPGGVSHTHHEHTSSQITSLILGLGILFSVFGLLMIYTRRKRG